MARFWSQRCDIDRRIMCLLSGITQPDKPLGVEYNYLTPVSCSPAPALLKQLLNVDKQVDANTPEEQETAVRLAIQAGVGRGGDIDDLMEEFGVLPNAARRAQIEDGVRGLFLLPYIETIQSKYKPDREMMDRQVNSLLNAQQALDPQEGGVQPVASSSTGDKASKWVIIDQRWSNVTKGSVSLSQAVQALAEEHDQADGTIVRKVRRCLA